MKIIFVFAALLLAITSVAAEASQSCGSRDHAVAATMAHSPTGDADCHNMADQAGGSAAGLGCAFAANCALLCGVTPPAGLDGVHAARFAALAFFASADRLAGAARQPEAPPPRSVLL